MDNSFSGRRFVLMISFDRQVMALPISPNSLFIDLVSRVVDEWPNLRSSCVQFRYDIGDYKNCLLKSDNDFAALLLLAEEFKPSRVDVLVISDLSTEFVHQPKVVHNQNSDISPGTCSSSSNPLSNVQEEVFPHYDVCPPIDRQDKLSDSWSSNIRVVGQKFLGGNKEFRQELSKYALMRGFKYHFMRNNKTSVSVVCAQKNSSGCKWRVSGTSRKNNPVFTINRLNLLHSCTDHLIKDDALRLAPSTMGSLFVQQVQETPDLSGKVVRQQLSKSFGLTVGYMKAWRTLQSARDAVYGDYKDSFNQLRWYSEAVKSTNPGSVVDLQCQGVQNQFFRYFIAFKACLDGFKFCRPMLFIDATSLKGRFKGQLLSATAKDGDNGLFPVAMAVVDVENIDNWTWFISRLRDHIEHDNKVFYLSDRHAGIMAAFPAVYDEPVHFFCLYHLYTNLKGMYRGGWSNEFRGKMVNLLGKAAYAPTPELFQIALDEFKESGGAQAESFLVDLPYEKWAVAYSPGIVRYGEMTSNAAESFNAMIAPTRSLPVSLMIDAIRQHLMQLHQERRNESKLWTGALTPNKELQWNTSRQIGRGWKIIRCAQNGVYEVISKTTQTVNTEERSCTCFQWQIQGFPCAHAVNVIANHLPSISGSVDPSFFTSKYKQVYSFDILPVPTSLRFQAERTTSDQPNILPPDTRATPGRPRRKRILSFGEKAMRQMKKWHCPYCSKLGRHDTKICAASLEAEMEKERELTDIA